jgi:surface protein
MRGGHSQSIVGIVEAQEDGRCRTLNALGESFCTSTTMLQPEPHSSNSNEVVAAAAPWRPLPDRTFSDDVAAAPLNEAVSRLLCENEPERDDTLPNKEACARQSSSGMSLPPAKDLLTGMLSRRWNSHSCASTVGTSSSRANSASTATTTAMHRQESLPGSYAVRGTNVHSSDDDSQWSDDDNLLPHRTDDELSVDDAPECSPLPMETVVTTAKLVTNATLDESERERIYRQAVKTVTSNAVVAQIVPTDKSTLEDGVSCSNNPSNMVAPTVKRHSRRRSLLLGLSCSLFVIGILLGVSVPYSVHSSSSSQPAPSTNTASSAPTIDNATTDPLLCFSYNIGCRAFATTEELYQAIDAADEVISYYADHPGNQTVLLQPAPVTVMYGIPLGRWNVSLITNFTRVFDPWRHLPFNPNRTNDQESKNTSRRIATLFNEDLSGWDVSNAETMFGMFAGAASFQGRGLENWDISRVVNLSFVFMDAMSFNGRIARWNTTSAVTMEGMFRGARPFDGDISAWNVSQVTNMASMLDGNYAFSGQDLHQWDVSKVKTMHSMFKDAFTFNGNISAWNVSRVESMAHMVRSKSSLRFTPSPLQKSHPLSSA